MEWTIVTVIVVIIGIVGAFAKPMSNWSASLAENTQSMKDLRDEFRSWDKRNDDNHAGLKADISRNREEVNGEIGRNRVEVNGVLKEHQKKIETNRYDIENHETRLQIIEKNK